MTESNITAKIRKLLALADSPNEHEASLAAERAQELMLKYSIDMATIAIEDNEGLSVSELRLETKTEPWRRQLAQAVAKSAGGRIVYTSGKYITFYAPAGSVQSIVDLFRYLENTLVLISAQATARRSETWVHGNTYRKSFLAGAVSRISQRLKARRTEMEVDNSKALVVVGNAVDDYVNEKHRNLRTRKYRQSFNATAYRSGVSAAGTISLGDKALRNRQAISR